MRSKTSIALAGRGALQSYQPYRTELLRREELQQLNRLRPAVAARDTALLWLQILLAWTVAALYPTVWCAVLMACAVGNRYYALYIIGHDGLHRRLHESHRVNDWWNDVLLTGPLGAITRLNRRNHMTHHGTLAQSADPDFYKYQRRATSGLAAYLWSLTGLPLVWNAVRNVYAGNRATDATVTASRGMKYHASDLCTIVGWQIVLVGGLTLTFGWWGYFLMWLAPVYAFTYAADIARVFCEHSVLDAEDSECGLVDRLVTFQSSWLERQFFAPMNMNHHVAHHLWPSIPYYNLPQATKLAYARAGGPQYSQPAPRWQGSYVGYLWRYAVAASCGSVPSLHSAKPEDML